MRTRQKSLILMNTHRGKCISVCHFSSLILVLLVEGCQLLLSRLGPRPPSLSRSQSCPRFKDPTPFMSAPFPGRSLSSGLISNCLPATYLPQACPRTFRVNSPQMKCMISSFPNQHTQLEQIKLHVKLGA